MKGAGLADKDVAALTAKEAVAELARLVPLINAAAVAYFTEAAPVMNDGDYDRLFARNLAIETRFPKLKRADSPNDRIGGPVADGFSKVEHAKPMLSLSNVFDDDDVADFLDRIRPCDAQQIVGSEERVRVITVGLAPKILLGQSIALDHGAHGTVQNEDSLRQSRLERRPAVGCGSEPAH